MENFVILDNLIPEIVSFENLSSSFDYVVRDLKEKQRKRFEAKKMMLSPSCVSTLKMEVFKLLILRPCM